jgi:hypothetical protein
MSRNFIWAAAIAVILLGATNAMAADAPTTPAPNTPAPSQPAAKLSRVLGGISAIDTKAKTITLSGFGGAADQTIAYNDDTRYMLDIPATVADIKVGDTLRAISFGDNANNATATTISPNFLNIVPPVDVNGPPFTGPFTPTEGVVASLSPLTITTADKKTITITIADDTRISKSKDATTADVKTGLFGSGIVKGDGANQVLTELHLIQIPNNN